MCKKGSIIGDRDNLRICNWGKIKDFFCLHVLDVLQGSFHILLQKAVAFLFSSEVVCNKIHTEIHAKYQLFMEKKQPQNRVMPWGFGFI